MADVKPIITREETADGWITRADYGKQGVSIAQAHMAQETPEQVAANRKELERVLARFGYRLRETTKEN